MTVFSQEVFGIIRCMSLFRLEGSNRDMIVLGTDSGRVVILEYSQEKGRFTKVRSKQSKSSVLLQILYCIIKFCYSLESKECRIKVFTVVILPFWLSVNFEVSNLLIMITTILLLVVYIKL